MPITRRHVGLFREIGDILNVKISGRSAFPYAAGEDREFCDRWLHHGYGVVYAPEVVVRHSHFLRFQTFCKQHFNYGRAALYFHKVRAERGQKRIKVEPLRFYLDLLRYPFMHLQAGRSKLLAILLLISQALNTAGFCRDALSRQAKRSIPEEIGPRPS